MPHTVTVTFSGRQRFASTLAACIRTAGGEVAWQSQRHAEGSGDQHVEVALRVSSTDDTLKPGARAAAKAGIAVFERRFPGRGSAVLVDDETVAE